MDFRKRVEWVWPPIFDSASARKAAMQGVMASAFCAAATIFFVILSELGKDGLGFDLWALTDAFLFILIGWGIFKMNRVAAVSGLALYFLERAMMWIEYGPRSPVMALIFVLMFINGIRGVMGHHEFKGER